MSQTTELTIAKQEYPLSVLKKDELYVQSSEDKKVEITTTLATAFAGMEDWEEKIKAIEIKDIDDKINIQLADTYRKNAKEIRIKYEKIFDAKRAEIQAQKAEYDLNDKLWLKAKQIMQIKLKSLEEAAAWKADYVKRFQAEQKELRTQKRINEVQKYKETNRTDFEEMTDENFQVFLFGLEAEYNAKIQAEQKAEEQRIAKEKADAEARELQRIENEKLKAQIETDRVANEKRVAEEQAILKAEREAKAKIEAELKAKIEAENKAKQESELKAKKESELKAKQEAEEKAEAERKAQAPVQKQLLEWIESFELPVLEIESEMKEAIIQKFQYFKNWAKGQVKED